MFLSSPEKQRSDAKGELRAPLARKNAA